MQEIVRWFDERRLRRGQAAARRMRIRFRRYEIQIPEERRRWSDLADLVKSLGTPNERELQQELARRLGCPFADLNRASVDLSAVRLLSRELALELNALPVKRSSKTLYVAVARPDDLDAMKFMPEFQGYRLLPVLATAVALRSAIERHY